MSTSGGAEAVAQAGISHCPSALLWITSMLFLSLEVALAHRLALRRAQVVGRGGLGTASGGHDIS
eukprot:8552391-Heterocapsa_arctica.AAC.1